LEKKHQQWNHNRHLHFTAIVGGYDLYQKYVADQKGEEYWADSFKEKLELSVDNTQLALWKYNPLLEQINKQDAFKVYAVYYMLLIYISIICLISVIIISYTRGITIGLESKDLFQNLKKLGANEDYINKCLKRQLSKVFIYPCIVGSALTFTLFCMILWANNNQIEYYEWVAIGINAILTSIMFLIMFLVNKFTYRKVKMLIEL